MQPICGGAMGAMRATYDTEANAAYVSFQPIEPGQAVEQVVLGRPQGDVVLDFDGQGRLLGVEVVGARELLSPQVLAEAERR